jgi:hypothetical protein
MPSALQFLGSSGSSLLFWIITFILSLFDNKIRTGYFVYGLDVIFFYWYIVKAEKARSVVQYPSCALR